MGLIDVKGTMLLILVEIIFLKRHAHSMHTRTYKEFINYIHTYVHTHTQLMQILNLKMHNMEQHTGV